MATAQRVEAPTTRNDDGPASADAEKWRRTRRTIAQYRSYGDAERAVDWLSDQGFAIERVAIVGTGLRSVEQVARRVTAGRAALVGAGEGALIGSLFAILFGIFFTGPAFGGLLAYSIVAGGIFGATFGALSYQLGSGGRRDFVSDTAIEAGTYEVQADDLVAEEAKRVLATMQGGTR